MEAFGFEYREGLPWVVRGTWVAEQFQVDSISLFWRISLQCTRFKYSGKSSRTYAAVDDFLLPSQRGQYERFALSSKPCLSSQQPCTSQDDVKWEHSNLPWHCPQAYLLEHVWALGGQSQFAFWCWALTTSLQVCDLDWVKGLAHPQTFVLKLNIIVTAMQEVCYDNVWTKWRWSDVGYTKQQLIRTNNKVLSTSCPNPKFCTLHCDQRLPIFVASSLHDNRKVNLPRFSTPVLSLAFVKQIRSADFSRTHQLIL